MRNVKSIRLIGEKYNLGTYIVDKTQIEEVLVKRISMDIFHSSRVIPMYDENDNLIFSLCVPYNVLVEVTYNVF